MQLVLPPTVTPTHVPAVKVAGKDVKVPQQMLTLEVGAHTLAVIEIVIQEPVQAPPPKVH